MPMTLSKVVSILKLLWTKQLGGATNLRSLVFQTSKTASFTGTWISISCREPSLSISNSITRLWKALEKVSWPSSPEQVVLVRPLSCLSFPSISWPKASRLSGAPSRSRTRSWAQPWPSNSSAWSWTTQTPISRSRAWRNSANTHFTSWTFTVQQTLEKSCKLWNTQYTHRTLSSYALIIYSLCSALKPKECRNSTFKIEWLAISDV